MVRRDIDSHWGGGQHLRQRGETASLVRNPNMAGRWRWPQPPVHDLLACLAGFPGKQDHMALFFGLR